MGAKAARSQGTTALTRWDEELARRADIATKTEANVGGGNMVGTKSGVLSYKGAAVPGNKMNVVVVDHILENVYYPGEYDPDNPSSPVCFAFSRTGEDMKPHPSSAKPQHATCAGCPQNEFGTADRGKGKACKNTRRLALITEADLKNGATKTAEVAYMRPPVTSVKGWAGFVRQVAEVLKRPPLGVVTEVSLVPDPKNQFAMMFKMVEAINDGPVVGDLLDKAKLVEKEIEWPYQAPAADAGNGKKKAAGKGKGKPKKF